MAEVRSRSSMIRFRVMEALTVNDGSVIYPFFQSKVLVDILVFRFRAWIEPGGLITSSTLVTPDPTIKLQFPLQFYHIFANKDLHTSLDQLLSNNIIPQHFWDDFIDTVTLYLQYLAGFAIKRRSGGLVLHVEVEVLAKEEDSNVQRMFAHIDAQLEEFIDAAAADNINRTSYVPTADSWWDKLAGFETVTFKKLATGAVDDHEHHKIIMEDAECSICHEEYKDGVSISKMPCNNSHWFHSVCIGEWLRWRCSTWEEKTCPICRWPLSLMTNICFQWNPISTYLH